MTTKIIGRSFSGILVAIILVITMTIVYAFPMQAMATEDPGHFDITFNVEGQATTIATVAVEQDENSTEMIPEDALPQEWADFL